MYPCTESMVGIVDSCEISSIILCLVCIFISYHFHIISIMSHVGNITLMNIPSRLGLYTESEMLQCRFRQKEEKIICPLLDNNNKRIPEGNQPVLYWFQQILHMFQPFSTKKCSQENGCVSQSSPWGPETIHVFVPYQLPVREKNVDSLWIPEDLIGKHCPKNKD